MSRYAKCEFLKSLTEEQRNQALSELDRLDEEDGKEAPAEDQTPEGEKPADPKPDEGEDAKACDPDTKTDETTDEKPENGAEDDDALLKEIRALKESTARILEKMEA